MTLPPSAILARTIIGIIGNIISFILFLSPVPTFRKVIRWKSTRGFSGVPYVVMLLNSLLWIFYGTPIAVHPNSILVATINSAGGVLEIAYIITFLLYANHTERKKTMLLLSMVLASVTLVVVLVMVLVNTREKRISIVGSLCVFVGICMYASPLTIMGSVIKTKSVKYMPFPLSFTYFINGLTWSTYGSIDLDIFLLIANGSGALLGAIQLMLYAKYRHGIHPEDQQRNKMERQENIGDCKLCGHGGEGDTIDNGSEETKKQTPITHKQDTRKHGISHAFSVDNC